MQIVLEQLLNDTLCRCSSNLKEYNDLKYKTLLVCQASQKIFNLSLLMDKLEKEKHSQLIASKLEVYSKDLIDKEI